MNESSKRSMILNTFLNILADALPTMGIIGIVLGILWFVFDWLGKNLLPEDPSQQLPSAIILPLLLMITILILLLVLGIIVTVFSQFNIKDETQPLGLPPGSIRAVIALLLIFIFAITSVFLYGGLTGQDKTGKLVLTANQFNSVSPERLISSVPTKCQANDIENNADDTENNCYLVELSVRPTEDAIDFANHVLTIVGTLVTTLTGFYFGDRSGSPVQRQKDNNVQAADATLSAPSANDEVNINEE